MGAQESGEPGVLGRIAASLGRRPWLGLVVWAVLVGGAAAAALGGITGETLFERLVSGAPTATSESSRADDKLTSTASSAKSQTVTLLVHGVDLTDPAVTAIGPDLVSSLGSDTVTIVDPLSIPTAPDGSRLPAVAPLFAEDGRGVLFTVKVSGVGDADPDAAEVDHVVSVLKDTRDILRTDLPDATVEVGSTQLLVDSIVAVSENDLQRGEGVALPIALLVMLVVFGGFIAAGVPLIGAIAAIIGALGALFGISHLMDIDTTVINVITAVGLGLSIDYGLLMVSRFREEYRSALAGHPGADRRTLKLGAIARTADTAGRTVLYSGTTFAIASLGLLVFEPRLVRAIGVGALSVTAIALASALTLVPALLGIAGDRLVRPGALTRLPLVGRAITRFGDVAPDEGVFSRLTRRVQRHPALITVLCALALLALASPVLSLRLANTSTDALPASSVQKVFVTTLTTEFPDAASPRIALVTDTEADATTWASQVESLPRVTSVGTPTELGEGWRTIVRVDPVDGIDVVREIRADRPDFPASVTGTDARTLDFSQSLLDRAPWAILIVALGTILLLFLMTGSLIVPLKALVASTLSLGASFGVLVWGFQWGNFAGLMGFDPTEVHGVDVLVLVLTLAFGFGLAMDYEMFILSRIKELVDAGVEGREAIALGLQRSGRIISSAGLIIVVVFAGFATGDLMVIKQLGVALAVAVVLDATLVRMLLVPAFMTWQERIMWWAPRWMKRIHSRFGLREG
ncbi:MAG: MMPL family transporter [Actinobacteria bacterium]|nr:MMPL family transporter [Actinomycetota bacterium]